MGNDGGSIPKRHELVRTATKRARDSDADRVRQLWAFCALSKLPLAPPVVACPLGRMYNKDALISHLLAPTLAQSPFGADGQQVAGHIRSLKDVVTLHLTPNPSLSPVGGSSSSDAPTAALLGQGEADRGPPAAFVCPISLREMNGSVRFVFRRPCGCVLSDAALRALGARDGACPVDGAHEAAEGGEVYVPLNPKGDEAEQMRDEWEERRARGKEEKKAAKAAKRKAGGGGDDAPAGKKAKKDRDGAAAAARAAAPAVKAGASVPQLSATLAAKLAEEKKKQSPAIASLYAKKSDDVMRDKDGRSNWMTISGYSRF
ncbi:Replication termination factor 2 [Rhodotorula kratochvilovae]